MTVICFISEGKYLMAQADNSKASASAIKQAQTNWNNFAKAASVCGGVTVVVLVLMALFLA